MRGIEAALRVCMDASSGTFASEALRKLYPEINSGDRDVAALLVYCTLRRQGLWKHLMLKYCRRNARALSFRTQTALMIGIAGLVELKHFAAPVLINAVLQAVKASGRDSDVQDVKTVHAVLRSVSEEAPEYLETLKKAASVSDQALYWGVPGWAAAQWAKERQIAEAKKLIKAMGMKTYLSLRLRSDVDREAWIKEYEEKCGKKAWASDLLANSVRTASTDYPPSLPGYSEGKVSPQTESSMFVVNLLAGRYKDGAILDMCSGRGVKTRQLIDMFPLAQIEAWDISPAKIQTAKLELMKLHAGSRVQLRIGDALKLKPKTAPSLVLLDAPCSGSGTWGRHPEGKWRMKPEDVDESAKLQKMLLERAADIVQPGGIVAYMTCSSFRKENEEVVADLLSKRKDIVELPVKTEHKFMQKGRPYGVVINPVQPWTDGFYAALLLKRRQEGNNA